MQVSPDFDRGPSESGASAVADHARFRTRSGGKVAVAAVLIAALGMVVLLAVAIPASAVDLDEMTVVTVAQDGSWGVATAASQGEAIAAAIRDCRVMAVGPSDCGAQFTTTRGGWVIASLCESHKVIVAAESREAAEQELLARERSIGRLHACTRLLTLGPGGVILPTLAAPAHQAGSRGRER